eukprot:3191477-Rhodomonas_salina.1
MAGKDGEWRRDVTSSLILSDSESTSPRIVRSSFRASGSTRPRSVLVFFEGADTTHFMSVLHIAYISTGFSLPLAYVSSGLFVGRA